MEIICTITGIINTHHPKQGITDLINAGFSKLLLDFSRFCPPEELENIGISLKKSHAVTAPIISQTPEKLGEVVAPLLTHYQSCHLQTPVAQAPYLRANTRQVSLTSLLLSLYKESIHICGQAGCQFLIIPPLFSGIDKRDRWKANKDFYLRLLPTAKEDHVTILLENQCGDINGHLTRGVCSDPQEAAFWVDELNREAGEERFGFCMDVGICNLCGQNIQEFVLTLGNRIKAVVLRDCDGHKESSWLPFTYSGFERCGTDWLGLIRGLRKIGFDGELILDFSTTATAFSPFLRPQLLNLAKATGEYFRWQIGIENLLKTYKSRVLFGAGNMCRNYMKCYGEAYPPLFTCDNNAKLWGTSFCGLEIKAPQCLRELPTDCAIFICNVYYREIEQQLRDMGIGNPIEFFSDEFMPSFYFDRLERRE